jgi:chorismate mutase
MPVRGVRGATTVGANQADLILTVTRDLLIAMVAENGIASRDIACAWFTVTGDLDAAFPARATRELGWRQVPLMDAMEVPVPGGLERCIRVLLLWNTDRAQADIVHVYQGEAATLRPDLTHQKEES